MSRILEGTFQNTSHLHCGIIVILYKLFGTYVSGLHAWAGREDHDFLGFHWLRIGKTRYL